MQHGRQEAVLKLLQLGADKTLKTKTGKCPADLAVISKNTQVQFFYDILKFQGIQRKQHIIPRALLWLILFPTPMSTHENWQRQSSITNLYSQISKILASSQPISTPQAFSSMENTLSQFFMTNGEVPSAKEW